METHITMFTSLMSPFGVPRLANKVMSSTRMDDSGNYHMTGNGHVDETEYVMENGLPIYPRYKGVLVPIITNNGRQIYGKDYENNEVYPEENECLYDEYRKLYYAKNKNGQFYLPPHPKGGFRVINDNDAPRFIGNGIDHKQLDEHDWEYFRTVNDDEHGDIGMLFVTEMIHANRFLQTWQDNGMEGLRTPDGNFIKRFKADYNERLFYYDEDSNTRRYFTFFFDEIVFVDEKKKRMYDIIDTKPEYFVFRRVRDRWSRIYYRSDNFDFDREFYEYTNGKLRKIFVMMEDRVVYYDETRITANSEINVVDAQGQQHQLELNSDPFMHKVDKDYNIVPVLDFDEGKVSLKLHPNKIEFAPEPFNPHPNLNSEFLVTPQIIDRYFGELDNDSSASCDDEYVKNKYDKFGRLIDYYELLNLERPPSPRPPSPDFYDSDDEYPNFCDETGLYKLQDKDNVLSVAKFTGYVVGEEGKMMYPRFRDIDIPPSSKYMIDPVTNREVYPKTYEDRSYREFCIRDPNTKLLFYAKDLNTDEPFYPRNKAGSYNLIALNYRPVFIGDDYVSDEDLIITMPGYFTTDVDPKSGAKDPALPSQAAAPSSLPSQAAAPATLPSQAAAPSSLPSQTSQRISYVTYAAAAILVALVIFLFFFASSALFVFALVVAIVIALAFNHFS